MIVSKSIKDYCDAILNNNLNFDFYNIDFDTISNEVCKFIKFDYRLFRKKKIINFLTKLTEIGLITNISLEFKKGDFKAYMRDDFKLYLNSKYVRKSSRSNLIITLIHEVSHLYIASRDNYEALLDLDKTFFKKYDKNDETIDDLRLAIENYIKWYNKDRINVKRKGLSPLQYRQQSFLNL